MDPYKAAHLQYAKTCLASPIIQEHLAGSGWVGGLSHFPFNEKGLEAAIMHRRSFEGRELLVERLKAQNGSLALGQATQQHIRSLSSPGTFCVTTGHQLCLLTGPLYFMHKIVSTIKLCRILKEKHPEKDFVPIFWMASEDHDLAEVDHFHAFGERFHWHTDQAGAVGRMLLAGIDEVIDGIEAKLGVGNHSMHITSMIREAYMSEKNLAAATRHFVNALFGSYGLVIIDGDDKELKRAFVPMMEQELRNRRTKELIEATVSAPEWKYKVQVNPRAINLFYLQDGMRSRIVNEAESGGFSIAEKRTTVDELVADLHEHPERFSPNVVLRPVYQECVLPNIAYVGGGGELAYWLQLKSTFEQFEMKMPVLVLRDHVLWLKSKTLKKMAKCGLGPSDLFRTVDELVRAQVVSQRAEEVLLNGEHAELKELFGRIKRKALALEPTLERSAAAEAARADNGIKRLEKRMLRAAKRQESETTQCIEEVLAEIFPNGTYQERYDNFLALYSDLGPQMFDVLLEHCDPLRKELLVLMEG